MSGKKKITISIFVILGSLILSGIIFLTTQQSVKPKVAGTSVNISNEVTIRIAENNWESRVAYEPKMTALAATEKATKGLVKTVGKGADAYVTSLNGIEANKSKREFWELLVNNESALVGAGSLELKAGDVITWKISSF